MVIETVEALVFDIDDTLYPFACGFTPHRNGEMVERFMVEKLGFADRAAAKALRDEYFERTHSTLKALLVAQEEGRLPAPFEQPQLGEWWAERCDHEGLLAPQPKFIADMAELPSSVRKIVFTNSPRQYALRVLRQLGLLAPAGADPAAAAAAAASGAAAAGAASGGGGGWCFAESDVWAVEDVLPACKPQPEAFRKVLAAAGVAAERSVMFEDSLKNCRATKALGMGVVFVRGAEAPGAADAASFDVEIQTVSELRERVPQLWSGKF